jgi:hypothetical protein
LSIFAFDAARAAAAILRRRAVAIAASLAAAVLLAAGADALLTALFARPNWTTLAVASLASPGGAPPRIVTLGSSRVNFDVDPSRLPRPAVNLSANYLDARYMRETLAVHRAALAAVDAAVLELDIVNLRFDTRALNPQGLADLGLSLAPSPRDFVTDPGGVLRRALLPVYAYRLTPAFVREARRRTDDADEPLAARPGFVPSKARLAFPREFAAARVALFRRQAVSGAAFPAAMLDDYVAMIEDLAARRVRVLLVRFPLYEGARDLFPPDWDAEVDAAARALAARLPTGVFAYWDASRFAEVASDDFRDPEHLNAAGAAKLTRALAARL